MIVLVDTTNLFYSAACQFNGTLLYRKYLDAVRQIAKPTEMIAYATWRTNSSRAFLDVLSELGFEVRTKPPRRVDPESDDYTTKWNVELTLDALRLAEPDDKVLIGSNNVDLLPLIVQLRNRGCEVHVLAIGTPKCFKPHATCHKVSGDMIDENRNVASA